MSGRASFLAIVYGEVQGVNYRTFTLRTATKLGLTGYVRNLPDNTVEIFAEGERKNLESLLEHLKIGPRQARVEKVKVVWGEYRSEFTDFQIKYC